MSIDGRRNKKKVSWIIEKLLETKLCGRNLMKEIKTSAAIIVKYPGQFFKCTNFKK